MIRNCFEETINVWLKLSSLLKESYSITMQIWALIVLWSVPTSKRERSGTFTDSQ